MLHEIWPPRKCASKHYIYVFPLLFASPGATVASSMPLHMWSYMGDGEKMIESS